MSTGNLFKKDDLTIGTHDGVFHCDEVLGCFLLKILFPQASIIRSRDIKNFSECDIVIDVGGVYDPEQHRYDHHQKSFEHTMSSVSDEIKGNIRLSSAGLIYHHFGKDILKKILNTTEESILSYIYKSMYNNFIKEIDGIDNGIPAFSTEPLYNICTHLSARVQRLNKPWYENENWDEKVQFQKAIDIVGNEFIENINNIKNNIFPAREIVLNAIQNRYNVHSSGEIIELELYCPWKDHFFELENEYDFQPQVKYVIFKSANEYRIQCVSITNKSFVCRKFLPASWQGLRTEELSQTTKIDGCIFVHWNGFIGGNKTREGALQMAIKSLEFES
ncbi:hypothetical protein PGB90_004281 [Kerria lacca]